MSMTTQPQQADEQRVRAVPTVTTTNVRKAAPTPREQARQALQMSMDVRQ
jgi:hypothetical protein